METRMQKQLSRGNGRWPARLNLSSPRPRGASPSGFVFYDEQFGGGSYEGQSQIITGFDATGGGAIRLVGGSAVGRRRKSTFFTAPGSSPVTRRDPSSAGTVTPALFSNVGYTDIKVYRSFVHDWTNQDFLDLGLGTEEGQRLAGIQFGEFKAKDMLNTALAALIGAFGAIGSAVTLDISGAATPTLNHPALNSGYAKLGDHSSSIVSLFMHSKPWHDLIGDAIVNQNFAAGQLAIYEGTTRTGGRVPVVTDDPSLFDATPNPDNYLTMGLVPDAVHVEDTEPEARVFGPVTGAVAAAPANITWRLQVNWAYTLKVKGMSYSSATDNPDSSGLATAGNWTQAVTSSKLGPGVIIRST